MFLFFARLGSSQCEIEITNYNGDVISPDNYSTNTECFKIKSKNCQNVRVTPEQDISHGIYEAGTYIIAAQGTESEENNVSITVTINTVPVKDRNYYYIINHCGTFPVITSFFYVIFNLTNNIKGEFQIGRPNTFNFTKIKENYPHAQYFLENGEAEHTFHYIQKIAHEDPNAYFHVRVDDIRIGQPFFWLLNQGIHQSRYEIHLCSDGTNTYKKFLDFKLNTLEGWNKIAEEFKKFYDQALIGALNINKKIANCDIRNWSFIFAAITYPNIYLELSNPEMITTEEEQLKETFKKMKMIKIDILGIINSQPEEKVDYLYEVSKINREEYRKKYFSNDGKKTCFILTTNPVNETQIKVFFTRTVKKYSNYTFVAKPHPSAPYSKNLSEWMNNEVKVIPFEGEQIPAEIIYSAFAGKVKVGGYPTSTFTSVNLDDVLFIYIEKMDKLFPPLDTFVERKMIKGELMNFESLVEEYPQCIPSLSPTPSNDKKSKFLKIGVPIISFVCVAIIVGIVILVIYFRKHKKVVDESAPQP